MKNKTFGTRWAIRLHCLVIWLGLMVGQSWAGGGGGFLEIRDGYFWDPATGTPFIARGPAYQVWNPPVFANQSFEQVAYDLRQFSKLRANSIRAELVWGELEVAEDVYDWSRADFLIETAEELGLKLFLLIGYQYPPSWFPEGQRCINDRGGRSDVLNYESPVAQQAYAEHIAAVVSRYRNSPAVGAWILGNEFAYFDLWEDPQVFPARRMLGYNPISQAAFRAWLREQYDDDLGALNANWNASFPSFDDVVMPPAYPAEQGQDPGYHDVIQWRKQSIANFLALGAKAAKDNDPNHLITYSMVGGIFSGSDANNTAEDPVTIVRHCAEAGAPLDFWSVNNYAWATLGSELRSADFGIAKYQELIDLPVMISETGHTSTENLLPGAGPRQAEALPSTLWESLSSGVVGIHFFHWNDRNNFTEDYFIRERGFGIVNQDRTSKGAVYDNLEKMLSRMGEIDLGRLLQGSTHPEAEVLIYLTEEGDMGFPRGNQENAMLWGALRRLGYQVGLIGREDFKAGRFGEAEALALSRCEQLEPDILDRILQEVIPAGIHVHANADVPGQFNAYGKENANWVTRIEEIFGLDVSNATAAYNKPLDTNSYAGLTLRGNSPLGPLGADFSGGMVTWKIWEGQEATAGTTVLTHGGLGEGAPGSLGLHILDHGEAKTAINTYALGDTHSVLDPPTPQAWDLRTAVLSGIYGHHFGVVPKLQLTGASAHYIMSDYRLCRNGSILISMLNERDTPVTFTMNAPSLANGKTVENLSEGGIVETDSDGILEFTLAGDNYLLLYIYDESGGEDGSLLDRSPYRVWFESAPQTVWPSVSDFDLKVGYDTRGEALELVTTLEMVSPTRGTHGSSLGVAVNGQGESTHSLTVPDPDLAAPDFLSSPDGGRFNLRASLRKNGLTVAESNLPVRMVWGVRPLSLPETVTAGVSYEIEVEWEELQAYLPGEESTTIDRAALFDSSAALRQHYNIVLELRDDSEAVVASAVRVTREATSSETFTIDVPGGAVGPFHWFAYTQTADGASVDIFESFEGWETGEAVANPPNTVDNPTIIEPWVLGTFTQANPQPLDFYRNHGIHIQGSHGSQSVFVVYDNHPGVGLFSGTGLRLELPEILALPSDPVELMNYRVSFDYRETNRLQSRMDIQLVDSAGRIIFLAKDYDPGATPDAWDTMTGTVNELSVAAWGAPGSFDYSEVAQIICNVSFLEVGVEKQDKEYVASLDNVRLDGPEKVIEGGTIDAFYDSRNDSHPDTDGDGIEDRHETNTGIFLGSEDTGSDPAVADSDGDGQGDGAELVAGTDPNSADDRFRAEVTTSEAGEVTISWFARTGRRYGIEFCDPEGEEETLSFVPLGEIFPVEVASNGPVSVIVSRPSGVPVRLFRVVGWMVSE